MGARGAILVNLGLRRAAPLTTIILTPFTFKRRGDNSDKHCPKRTQSMNDMKAEELIFTPSDMHHSSSPDSRLSTLIHVEAASV